MKSDTDDPANTLANKLERLTRSLPREIQPPRDLWPDIHAQITREHGSDRFRDGVRHWRPLALAASLLVALSSTLTLWLAEPAAPLPETAGVAWQEAPVIATRYAGALEAEFAPARLALRAELPRYLDQLDPEAREALLSNLREIDTATQEIRGAIGRDPNAIYLVEMLVALYAREIDILRNLNQPPTKYSQETQL